MARVSRARLPAHVAATRRDRVRDLAVGLSHVWRHHVGAGARAPPLLALRPGDEGGVPEGAAPRVHAGGGRAPALIGYGREPARPSCVDVDRWPPGPSVRSLRLGCG